MMERFFDKLTGRTRVQVLSRRALEPEAKRTWIKSYKDGPGRSPAFYDLAAAIHDGPGDLMPGPPEPCWINRSETYLPLDPAPECSAETTPLDLDCIITDNLTGRTYVQVLSRRALEPEAKRTWIKSYKDGPSRSSASYNLAAATHDGPGDLMPGSPEPCWIVRSENFLPLDPAPECSAETTSLDWDKISEHCSITDEPETPGEKRRSSGSRWRQRLRSIFCMSRESVKVTPFTPALRRPSTKDFGCQVTEEDLSLGPKVTVIHVKPMKHSYMVDASTQVDKDEISS
ncbi:uncharacterized protein [Engystomops pustulosus]|uniref:uncharacterized protein isoform X1 n=1 Tax=Engystomops pustulosus TaxID=76066 RepID=UPI003AFA20E1